VAPLVLIVGRIADHAVGVRGEAFAAGQRYCTAIQRAGGIPLILPPIVELGAALPTLLKRVDAVVMHGGSDVDPRRYGATTVDERVYGIQPAHDEIELALVDAVVDADLPLLAICRGMQVLNVALGGTLQQDIGTESHWFAEQVVDLEPDSAMAAAMGTDTPTCHCVHHQGLERVADGVHVVGRTADGLIHAAEVTSMRFGLAVQWHPEDTAASDPTQQSLFTTLVAHT